MPYFFVTSFARPDGQQSRAIVYAPTQQAATTRVLEWMGSNPFRMGATDFRSWFDDTAAQARNWQWKVSGARPSAQAGDVSFDLPGPTGNRPPEDDPPPPLPGAPIPSALDSEMRAQTLYALGQRFGNRGQADLADTIAGRNLAAHAPDYENVSAFQEAVSGRSGEKRNPDAFRQFVLNTSPTDLGTEAARAFRILSGQQAPAVAIDPAWQKQFAQPDEQQAQQLAALAGTALGSRYSPLALRLLNFPGGKNLRDRFLAESGADPNSNFIEFVRKNFPLLAGI
jgi:hypothetical protein